MPAFLSQIDVLLNPVFESEELSKAELIKLLAIAKKRVLRFKYKEKVREKPFLIITLFVNSLKNHGVAETINKLKHLSIF